MRTTGWMALLGLLAFPAAAAGQQGTQCAPAGEAARAPGAGPQGVLREYDVVVDVPGLCVERIRLNVQNLDARLSLNARVANLVRVNAGADVHLGEVDVTIRGVRARALLLVDLDNVVYVVDRALSFVDENPDVVSQLVGTVNSGLGAAGGVASQAVGAAGQTLNNATGSDGLLSQTVNTLGQTVRRTVDPAGNIVERTTNAAGGAVGARRVGRLLDLPVLRESTNAAGQTVRSVRDPSGAVVEYALDEGGRVVRSRVTTRAQGGSPR